jgi:hypothetical protein
MKILILLFVSLILLQPLPTYKAVQGKDTDFLGETEDGVIEVLSGCSWYCGGAMISEFNSSSDLPAYKDNIYIPDMAHDFDVTTAWIEGKKDYGIGEYLEYNFGMTSVGESQHLGINKLIVANGYKKTKKTWEENSRVKKLKMYVNDIPFGVIELLDSFEFQTIDIPVIMLSKQELMKIKFEIMEVYPGTKYKDTAISELLFDGVGVH